MLKRRLQEGLRLSVTALIGGATIIGMLFAAKNIAHAGPREEVAKAVVSVSPPSEFSLFLLLNGELSKIGVLTSTGASVTNATTGVPFTLNATTDCVSRVFLFQCDTAQANVGAGSTCDTTVTGSNHRKQIANAWDPYYMRSDSTTFCLDAPASTTINCAVFCMK